ncbi:MAG: Na+/H+ antiporter subunit D, partial [Myxococcota bacterium]|nr:Na+/H+ antiporter subunit D [Myxococcota bacterium]
MNALLVAPVAIPLVTAVVLLLLRPSRRVDHALAALGGVASLGAALALLARVVRHGVVATQMGDWVAPFGIT